MNKYSWCTTILVTLLLTFSLQYIPALFYIYNSAYILFASCVHSFPGFVPIEIVSRLSDCPSDCFWNVFESSRCKSEMAPSLPLNAKQVATRPRCAHAHSSALSPGAAPWRASRRPAAATAACWRPARDRADNCKYAPQCIVTTQRRASVAPSNRTRRST